MKWKEDISQRDENVAMRVLRDHAGLKIDNVMKYKGEFADLSYCVAWTLYVPATMWLGGDMAGFVRPVFDEEETTGKHAAIIISDAETDKTIARIKAQSSYYKLFRDEYKDRDSDLPAEPCPYAWVEPARYGYMFVRIKPTEKLAKQIEEKIREQG